MNSKLLIKLLSEKASIPERATDGSAGLDLRACIDSSVAILPGKISVIPTGIAIALADNNHAAFVFARSGLAIRHGISLANGVGVIDSDYRGELCVGLINNSAEAYTVEPGERIAQLVVLPISTPVPETAEELPDTSRGDGGFGSTGRA